jgi:hypothetical protein
MRGVWMLALVALVMTSVPVAAHGTIKPLETETLVLLDEGDDSVYATAAYDIYQVYAGEAFIEALGDGLYFRTILFGSWSEPKVPHNEYKVVFTLAGEGFEVSRFMATRDGRTFTTDFDALVFKASADEVIVERAFIAYNGTALRQGVVVTTFVVESFTDGELRDRAPGGVYVPGSQGLVSVPLGSSRQVVSEYPLRGPSQYFSGSVSLNERYSRNSDSPEVELRFTVKSLLTEADQNVWVLARPFHSHHANETQWMMQPKGESGGLLKAKATRTFVLLFHPQQGSDGLVHPLRVDVVSDLGGRSGVTLGVDERGLISLSGSSLEEVPARPLVRAPFPEMPAPGLAWVVLALVAGLMLRRR